MSRQNPDFPDLAVAVSGAAEGGAAGEAVTARVAGGLIDLKLPVSPKRVGKEVALQNMAKAVNIGLREDFLPTELEPAYRAAKVSKGMVRILHREYIGLGDGLFAQVGRFARSLRLTLEGPDPTSPEGQMLIREQGVAPISGLFNLLARKLDLVQEYEDMVPIYVEQMLDRLEAVHLIVGWDRGEWTIDTTRLGLDVLMLPEPPPPEEA